MPEPKSPKPNFETVITDLFDGDMLQNALDFAASLRDNKIAIARASGDAWKITYKGKGLGRILWLGKNTWAVETYRDESQEFADFIKNENLQEIMWDNIFQCRGCNPKLCAGQANKPEEGFTGFTKTFFGKEFTNTCKHWVGGVFRNPDAKTINCIEKVLDFKKLMIMNYG